jgi:hypothetical protein
MITRITILALLVVTFASIGTKTPSPIHKTSPHAMCCDGDPITPIGK